MDSRLLDLGLPVLHFDAPSAPTNGEADSSWLDSKSNTRYTFRASEHPSTTVLQPEDTSLPSVSVIQASSRTLVFLSNKSNPELVGEFKIPKSGKAKTGMLQMRRRGAPVILSDVFSRASAARWTGMERKCVWQWNFSSQQTLYWDVSSSAQSFTCYPSNRASKYATLHFGSDQHTLDISSNCTHFFDDVLMSALILEQWRQNGLFLI